MLEESTTYQEIFEKGVAMGLAKAREEGLREGAMQADRRILLRLGSKRFGPPGEAVTAALEGVTDLDRLRELVDRLLDAASWEELLAVPR